jgi:hypothetical protein
MPDPQDLVTVLETADVNLLVVIKSLLDGAEIPYLIQGEEALSMLPVGRLGGPFARRGLAAAIMVPEQHAESARALLAATEDE